MIAQYHLDVAFVGTDGFTVTDGCTTHDEMEAHTDLAFIRQAARTVVIADSSKIGKVTFARICGPEWSTRWSPTRASSPDAQGRRVRAHRSHRGPVKRVAPRPNARRHASVIRSRVSCAPPVSASNR